MILNALLFIYICVHTTLYGRMLIAQLATANIYNIIIAVNLFDKKKNKNKRYLLPIQQ